MSLLTLSSLGSVDFSFFVSFEFCFHSKFPVHLGKFIAASGVVKCLCLESAECKLKKKKNETPFGCAKNPNWRAFCNDTFVLRSTNPGIH